jgi:hypothetical protein
MKYRKLRIALSVACGILCLLLIVLCVRSYWHSDVVETRSGWSRWLAGSGDGWFLVGSAALSEPVEGREWRIWTQPPSRVRDTAETRVLGFVPMHAAGDLSLSGPYWLCIVVLSLLGGLAAAPLIYPVKRFSLRTLLIGMTLVAALLGAVIWAARS